MERGDAGKALKSARELQRYYPESGLGYQLEGSLELQRGKFKEAEQALREAYARTPNSEIVLSLYRARQELGDGAGAREVLAEWLKKTPDDTRVRLLLASRLQADGAQKQAVAQYEKVRDAEPDNVIVWNNLAWLYLEGGDSRALRYAERAYELAPERAEIIDTYGWMLVQRGDINKGLDMLKAAASRAPHIPSIQYHVAVAMEKSGNPDGARKELQRILNSQRPFPERPDAQQLLQRLTNEK